jgi:hypothetical protein
VTVYFLNNQPHSPIFILFFSVQSIMATFGFGPIRVPAAHVFFRSQYSFAAVNLKPVLPGFV